MPLLIPNYNKDRTGSTYSTAYGVIRPASLRLENQSLTYDVDVYFSQAAAAAKEPEEVVSVKIPFAVFVNFFRDQMVGRCEQHAKTLPPFLNATIV